MGVWSKITKSSPRLQLSIYQRSYSTRRSIDAVVGVGPLHPFTCAHPVSPGFTRRFAASPCAQFSCALSTTSESHFHCSVCLSQEFGPRLFRGGLFTGEPNRSSDRLSWRYLSS